MSWAEITEYVLQLPHQEKLPVPKGNVVHPQAAGIPYTYGAYRFTVPDGRAIDIKEDGDCWCIHWDWHHPAHLIEHGLDDAPVELLLVTTLGGAATGAVSSAKGKKGEGALCGAGIGFGVGLLALLLRAIARRN
jgi:hypothetical protein